MKSPLIAALSAGAALSVMAAGATFAQAPAAPAQKPAAMKRQHDPAEHAQRLRRFAQHAAAVKQFYAQLTPAQQKAFDAMHQGGKHKRMMKRHMGGHGG